MDKAIIRQAEENAAAVLVMESIQTDNSLSDRPFSQALKRGELLVDFGERLLQYPAMSGGGL